MLNPPDLPHVSAKRLPYLEESPLQDVKEKVVEEELHNSSSDPTIPPGPAGLPSKSTGKLDQIPSNSTVYANSDDIRQNKSNFHFLHQLFKINFHVLETY